MKLFKVVLVALLYFAQARFSYAQDTLNTTQKTEILNSYNIFLNELGLNKIITATSISYHDQFSQNGKQGAVTIPAATVLKLEPTQVVAGAFKFAEAWNDTVNMYNKLGGIYNLLFAKWSHYNNLPLGRLVISLDLKSTPQFAFLVYFNNKVTVNEFSIGSRGNGDTGPGDLDDISTGGYFEQVNNTVALPDKISAGLTAFFETHKHKGKIAVSKKTYGSGAINFKVSNVDGEVTSKLNEVIVVNIFITQAADKRYANVAFLFTVLCSGGIFKAPSSIDEYRDALPLYTTDVKGYGMRLKGQLKKILNVK